MRLDVECGRRGDREGEEEARRELHDVERPDELLQLRRRVDDRRDDAREHHRRVADRRGGRAAIGSGEMKMKMKEESEWWKALNRTTCYPRGDPRTRRDPGGSDPGASHQHLKVGRSDRSSPLIVEGKEPLLGGS